jgi:hypothetical protein
MLGGHVCSQILGDIDVHEFLTDLLTDMELKAKLAKYMVWANGETVLY